MILELKCLFNAYLTVSFKYFDTFYTISYLLIYSVDPRLENLTFFEIFLSSKYQAIPGNDQIASPTNQKASGSKLKRTS